MLRHRLRFRRKPAPPPARTIFAITLFLFVVIIFGSLAIIDKGIEPTLMDIADIRTDEYATRAINSAVRFVEEYEFDDVSSITYNDDGNVSQLSWNASVIGEINRVATDRVEEFFRSMNRGEIPSFDEALEEPIDYGEGVEGVVEGDQTVVEIPLGQATGNTILANLGPSIPVNLELVGSVQTEVVRESQPIGVNGTFYTIYLLVEADVQIIIPFSTEVAQVSTTIDIDSGVITGDVPEFYSESGDPPSISVPKESISGD